MTAPLLIALPHGFNASGVTAWAVRLANALAWAGRAVGLVVHDVPSAQRAVEFSIDQRVDLFDARALPPLDACAGDLSPFLPVYRLGLSVLQARAGGGPVVCSPNLLGDCYGLFAALSRERPGTIRTIAVHHSDIRYNDAVCAHYAMHLSALVGVSERITERLGAMLPTRGADVFGIPYGVETPPAVTPRPPLGGRPLRLLYAGRMDHEQKRVRALPAMAEALWRGGLPFELVMLGDGPASGELDTFAAACPSARRLGAAPPEAVRAALRAADFFVLPSRYEGLSVALLEALAEGCVPVLTPSRSGTGQLVGDGATGFLASAGPDDSPEDAGIAIAEAVRRAAGSGDAALHAVRERALALVRSRFSAELCARRYAAVIDRAAASPPRPWPAHMPAAFTGSGGGGSGTVPADAAERMRRALHALAGRPVAIFGVGRHTLELEEVIRAAPARIVAFLDDDHARHGRRLWGVPIVVPEQAAARGARDVVVSSWLHESAMRERCLALAAAGLRIHTLYAAPAPVTEPAPAPAALQPVPAAPA